MSSKWLKGGIYVPVAKPTLFQVLYYQDGITDSHFTAIVVICFLFLIAILVLIGVIFFYSTLFINKYMEVQSGNLTSINFNGNTFTKTAHYITLLNNYITVLSPFIINAILLNLVAYIILVVSFSVENAEIYMTSFIIFITILLIFISPFLYRQIKKILASANPLAMAINSLKNSLIPIYTIYKLIIFISDPSHKLTNFSSFISNSAANLVKSDGKVEAIQYLFAIFSIAIIFIS